MTDVDVNSPSIQEKILELQEKLCHNGSVSFSGWCPEMWDGILCWPSTPSNETSIQSCPYYIAGFDWQANATRQCMWNGQWYWNAETNSTWSNYTQCYSARLVTVLMDLPEHRPDNVTLIKRFIPIVKTISTIGYAVSFSTLVVAFLILATIKKLRCSRNMLHMHLFSSFITRAIMALLKDILFVSGIGLSSDVLVKNGASYWLDDEIESNWHCKAFTSIWQYFILANYAWILMEGLYLHKLVFFALYTETNSNVLGYIILGWGLPAIFVLPWVILRKIYEDTYCWTTHKNSFLFLVIRVPTMLSILINFILFVNIVRVLLVKLQSPVSEENQTYKRWARSTLVLVPLFGVHYTVFLGMSYSIGVNETVEIVWLFCDQLFASFQGFFVAVLYCFMNAEVRTELRRSIRCRRYFRNRTNRQCRSCPMGSNLTYCSNQRFLRSRNQNVPSRPNSWFQQSADNAENHKVQCDTNHSNRNSQVESYEKRRANLITGRSYDNINESDSTLCTRMDDVESNGATFALCRKCEGDALLPFYSDTQSNTFDKRTNRQIRQQHRWSDSEFCHLAYELHNMYHHGDT